MGREGGRWGCGVEELSFFVTWMRTMEGRGGEGLHHGGSRGKGGGGGGGG